MSIAKKVRFVIILALKVTYNIDCGTNTPTIKIFPLNEILILT